MRRTPLNSAACYPFIIGEIDPMMPLSVEPPLRKNDPDAILKYRESILAMCPRRGNESYHADSLNWQGDLSASFPRCAENYIRWGYVDFIAPNMRTDPHLCDRFDELAGEVRTYARHIKGVNFSRKSHGFAGLRDISHANPSLDHRIIDYHPRGVRPVYRWERPPYAQDQGAPYKKPQRMDINAKLRKDVRNWIISACVAKFTPDAELAICTSATFIGGS